jgi:hypothetical protein
MFSQQLIEQSNPPSSHAPKTQPVNVDNLNNLIIYIYKLIAKLITPRIHTDCIYQCFF